MRITVLAFSVRKGGAALACANFVKIFSRYTDVEVIVADEKLRVIYFLKRIFGHVLARLDKTYNPVKASLNFFSCPECINRLRAVGKENKSIINLHWINNDVLSIFRLNLIPRFSIVTLHDEWWYMGAEHCHSILDDEVSDPAGVKSAGKPRYGFLNRYVWNVKRKFLETRNDLVFTVPSSWMKSRAENSVLLKNKCIELVPNPVDTQQFSPCSAGKKRDIRIKNGFSEADLVVGLGSVGLNDPMKGFTYLLRAFELLKNENLKIVIAVFGRGILEFDSFSTRNFGYIADKNQLCDFYNQCDFVIVPSLLESFGLVAAESLSSGTPVVAFKTSGLQDLILDGVNGFLATAFDEQALALAIKKMIMLDGEARRRMGSEGRAHILANYSEAVIEEKLKKICQTIQVKMGLKDS